MKFGYVRVSHKSQNEARQISALTKYVERERIFVDKFSGKNFDRPQYQLLKNVAMRNGDELFVTSLDRLGRDKVQLSDEAIAKIFFDMMSQVMIEVMSALAESERILIRRRQAEGIAEWRRTGKKK